jgi:hypothetical protein
MQISSRSPHFASVTPEPRRGAIEKTPVSLRREEGAATPQDKNGWLANDVDIFVRSSRQLVRQSSSSTARGLKSATDKGKLT